MGLWEGKDCGIASTLIYVSLGIYTLNLSWDSRDVKLAIFPCFYQKYSPLFISKIKNIM